MSWVWHNISLTLALRRQRWVDGHEITQHGQHSEVKARNALVRLCLNKIKRFLVAEAITVLEGSSASKELSLQA